MRNVKRGGVKDDFYSFVSCGSVWDMLILRYLLLVKRRWQVGPWIREPGTEGKSGLEIYIWSQELKDFLKQIWMRSSREKNAARDD